MTNQSCVVMGLAMCRLVKLVYILFWRFASYTIVRRRKSPEMQRISKDLNLSCVSVLFT